MPDAERARSVNTLSKVFALGSIGLAIVVVWMVIDDYTREWKDYQRRFYQLDYRVTREARRALETRDYQTQKAALDKELAAADASLKQHQKEYDAAMKRLRVAETELYKVNQLYQFAKSRYSAARYEYETEAARTNGADGSAAQKRPQVISSKKELDAKKAVMDQAERQYNESEARHQAAQAEVDKYLSKIEEVNKKKLKLNEQVERLTKKLDRINPDDFSKIFLNAPLLDFMSPSYKIQQVVVDGVSNDLNFVRIPRVDRCTTCHMAVENKAFDDPKRFPHPFRTHPNLDLFVGAKSKHPTERFGCTACHQGRDRGTTFYTAVHWPQNEAQEKAWHKKHGWHEFEHWDTPMMAGHYVEGQCYKCHKGQTYIPQADHLNRGRILFERAGCYGCHKVQGLEGLRKAGPDLLHLSAKTTPEWAFKWVKNPKGFRPTTRMPRFFDLTNSRTPDDLVRNNVEAHAMVSYLFNASEKLDYAPVPLTGDPQRGKELVNSIGCVGCHYVETPKQAVPVDDRRMFGPTLDKLGSKTTATWVFHWVKDPKHYFPQTYMPNLRLSDPEAMDITSYLMSLRDPAFEAASLPAIDTAVLDSLTRDYMRLTYSEKDTQANLASWPQEKKAVFLGERLITRYGCFGCHNIKGFEKVQNIGTELTEEGSKNIHQLDFGFVNIPHTRHDWFYQKLKDPRIFDMMPDLQNTKVKGPNEKLKMPNFQFSDEEIRALVTFLLGLTKERIAPELTRNLTPKEAMIEEGRRLVKKFNCQGCHILEGLGGDIRKTINDPGYYPPILEGEGEMVKSDWLFHFLSGPTPIRPWLRVRMPTFNFSDTDLNTLTRYFAYLASTDYPYEHYPYAADSSQVAAGKALMDKGQCFKCHIVNGKAPANDAANLAPDLGMARTRLRPQWIVKWLQDPQNIKPGTRMPTFFVQGNALDPAILDGKPDAQMSAIRDYVLTLGGQGASAANNAGSSAPSRRGRRGR